MNVMQTQTAPGPVIGCDIQFTAAELASLIAALALVPPTHSSFVVLQAIKTAFPQVQPAAS